MQYHNVLLSLPNVTITRCTVLNPASLLPTEADGEPNSLLAAIAEVCSPRPDLTGAPYQTLV